MFLNKRKAIFLISVFSLIFILIIDQVKSQTIKIVDGDTIHLNGEKIRFTGIDTPELKQTCFKDTIKDPCGVTAKQILIDKIGNNNVKCIKTYDNKFSDIYTLASNVNCSNLNGNEIKDLLRKHKKINDLSITSGFYWKRTNGYYLFRNTNFNNKKVILYTIIDADTYKIRSGYPKIVNNLTFPGLTLNKVISSILYAGNDDIYIIYL